MLAQPRIGSCGGKSELWDSCPVLREADTEGVVHTSPGQRPGFIGPTTTEALKARLISQAPRIFALSIPHVPLVEGHIIFPQQLAVFLLERFCFVMRLLVFDVTHKIVQLTVADRKISITSLPKE